MTDFDDDIKITVQEPLDEPTKRGFEFMNPLVKLQLWDLEDAHRVNNKMRNDMRQNKMARALVNADQLAQAGQFMDEVRHVLFWAQESLAKMTCPRGCAWADEELLEKLANKKWPEQMYLNALPICDCCYGTGRALLHRRKPAVQVGNIARELARDSPQPTGEHFHLNAFSIWAKCAEMIFGKFWWLVSDKPNLLSINWAKIWTKDQIEAYRDENVIFRDEQFDTPMAMILWDGRLKCGTECPTLAKFELGGEWVKHTRYDVNGEPVGNDNNGELL